jgi:hypothetical protein
LVLQVLVKPCSSQARLPSILPPMTLREARNY